MKDVVSCDKLREAAKQALYPKISEWGNPGRVMSARSYLNLTSSYVNFTNAKLSKIRRWHSKKFEAYLKDTLKSFYEARADFR